MGSALSEIPYVTQSNDDEDRRSNNRRQILLQVGCWPSAFPLSLAHNPDIGVGPIRNEAPREVSNPQLDIATRNGLEMSTKPRPGIAPHNRGTMIDDHTSQEISRLGLTCFTNPSYMLDYYQFEWFRILVALVAWLVTDLVAQDLYFLDKNEFPCNGNLDIFSDAVRHHYFSVNCVHFIVHLSSAFSPTDWRWAGKVLPCRPRDSATLSSNICLPVYPDFFVHF